MVNSSNDPDVFLIFEMVIYVPQENKDPQQITCAYGQMPVTSITPNMNKRPEIELKPGNPYVAADYDVTTAETRKAGFFSMKDPNNINEVKPVLALTVKPVKLGEHIELFSALMPEHHVGLRSMLSFRAAFRVYCQENLKASALELVAPGGNFVFAILPKIMDNPNILSVVASCWELEVAS